MLPPTADALELHLVRSNYQAKIWLQASDTHMEIDSPSACGGWKTHATGLHME